MTAKQNFPSKCVAHFCLVISRQQPKLNLEKIFYYNSLFLYFANFNLFYFISRNLFFFSHCRDDLVGSNFTLKTFLIVVDRLHIFFPQMSVLFFNRFVNVFVGNFFFFENCDLEDTSLANKPKKCLKKILFYCKIGLIKLPPIAKIMEKQNFKCVYLETMILCLQTY